MATTYEAIATVTVGSGGAASIDFTSIPATYTDLVVKLSARAVDGGDTFASVKTTFNGSTSGYTNIRMQGDGSNDSSGSDGTDSIWQKYGTNGSNTTANTFGDLEIYIPNYASSDYKSTSSDSVGENNATEVYSVLNAGLWSNTAAITSIKLELIYITIRNFVQYSTATLYGITNS